MISWCLLTGGSQAPVPLTAMDRLLASALEVLDGMFATQPQQQQQELVSRLSSCAQDTILIQHQIVLFMLYVLQGIVLRCHKYILEKAISIIRVKKAL